jgi:hypothetical protein
VTLPSPNLDDRRFQQLVDEAKRFIQQRCPEWTDHNVSDPGVTLIEAFAHMTDQLLYRLNRVPEKNYLAFLDLLGVTLHPPLPARTEVTFWLSAPQPSPVLVRAGTEVATVRTETEEALVFATSEDLAVVPCTLDRLLTQPAGGRPADRTEQVSEGGATACFSAAPVPGDAVLFGLSDAAPHCAVVLRLASTVDGIGVNPRRPPLAWEANDGAQWVPCEVERDTTGGLNRPGEVVLHLPGTHARTAIGGHRAGWVRCRVVAARPGQPFYSASPVIRGAGAFTIGGTAPALHAETVLGEILGEAEGVAGQRFRAARPPILRDGSPLVVEVGPGPGGAAEAGTTAIGALAADETAAEAAGAAADTAGWQAWTEVEAFGTGDPDERVVVVDRTAGEIAFAPAVRQGDGSLLRYAAVPPKGARVRIRRYRTGGGRRGNVAAHALTVLRSSIPYIAAVDNRAAAFGGVDGESVQAAKLRAPLELRALGRAVTAQDYELLARRAAPAAARIRALSAGDGAAAGGVRVLVVPEVVRDGGRLRIEQLDPPAGLLEAIAGHLGERRQIGVRLSVEPPLYQGVTVVARLVARPGSIPATVRTRALDALYRRLDPLTGGPEGRGRPFGRALTGGEVHAILQAVAGVEMVEELRLFPADPLTGRRGEPADRVEIDRHALVFSFEHQVRVDAG